MSVLDTITPRFIKDARAAEAEKVKTQADLKDAVRKAREAIDAAVAKKESAERHAEKAGNGAGK